MGQSLAVRLLRKHWGNPCRLDKWSSSNFWNLKLEKRKLLTGEKDGKGMRAVRVRVIDWSVNIPTPQIYLTASAFEFRVRFRRAVVECPLGTGLLRSKGLSPASYFVTGIRVTAKNLHRSWWQATSRIFQIIDQGSFIIFMRSFALLEFIFHTQPLPPTEVSIAYCISSKLERIARITLHRFSLYKGFVRTMKRSFLLIWHPNPWGWRKDATYR